MLMKKFLSYMAGVGMLLVAFTACSSGFSQKEADGLLQKDKLTSDEYDRLLELYETAIDLSLIHI